MSDEQLETFQPVALAYSAPTISDVRPRSIPTTFYNAFPDLNDVAADRSRSAFPTRAKYHLPLNSIFVPTSTTLVRHEDVPQYPWTEEALQEAARRFREDPSDSRPMAVIPQDIGDARTFRLHYHFEAAHQRLSTADQKTMFRIYHLANFYDEFDKFLQSDEKIKVPLIPNRSGSDIQRLWADINLWFTSIFQAVDEAVSLSYCLEMLDDEERRKNEALWVSEHQREIEDFDRYYSFFNNIRKKGESLFEGNLSFEKNIYVADLLIKVGLDILSLQPVGSFHIEDDEIDLEYPTPWSRLWPSIIAEDHPTSPSQIGSAQRLIAYNSAFNQRGNDVTNPLFQYVQISLVSGSDGFSRVEVLPTITFEDLLRLGFRDSIVPLSSKDGSYLAYSVIFAESMRQQICTGVGLRCPYEYLNGPTCCGNTKYLERIWNKTHPWKWEGHWQRPPCLK